MSNIATKILVIAGLFQLTACGTSTSKNVSQLASMNDNQFFNALSTFNGHRQIVGIEVDGIAVDVSGSTPSGEESLFISVDGSGARRSGSITVGTDCTLTLSAKLLVEGISTRNVCRSSPSQNGNNVMQVSSTSSGIVAREAFQTVWDDNSFDAKRAREQLKNKTALVWLGAAKSANLYGTNNDSRYLVEADNASRSQEVNFITVRNGTVRIGVEFRGSGHSIIFIAR